MLKAFERIFLTLPALSVALICKYIFPVPLLLVIVCPLLKFVHVPVGVAVLVDHWYCLVATPDCVSATLTVVLCDFLAILFPFVPNDTVGMVLSILLTVTLKVPVFPKMSSALNVYVPFVETVCVVLDPFTQVPFGRCTRFTPLASVALNLKVMF